MAPTSLIYLLPPELVEETLIICAARGYSTAIAAFACTCRHFNRLVYRPTDHHLWREVFLTTFDDPRTFFRCIQGASKTGRIAEVGSEADVVFDWAEEFMRRMGAAKMIRRHIELTPETIDMFADSQEIKDIPFSLQGALETIVSVLDTSPPFPSHHTEIPTTTPKFPPIVILHASTLQATEYTSRNTAWVEDIFKHGYPPALVKQHMLAGFRPSEHMKATEDVVPTSSEEGKLFHRLIFRKGFLPIPSFTPSMGLDPWEPLRSSERFRCKASQSVDEQNAAVREVARSKVYNLRYLRPERSWGPFLPSGTGPLAKSKGLSNTFPDFERELSRYMLNVGNLIVGAVDGIDEEDDEYVPGGDEDEAEDSDDDVQFLEFGIGGHPSDPKLVGPKPHQVVPDYSYLAAARLLIEANLQDNPTGDGLDGAAEPENVNMILSAIMGALGCLDFGRMGGVPGFWDQSWVKSPSVDIDCVSAAKGKQKATAIDDEEVFGWDWAGVTGLWMRVICWLDYRDLLLHNLHGYKTDDLAETIRFFPMTLRVRGYSKPPEPDPDELSREEAGTESLVWKLPVIHVEGESRGSDVEGENQIIRRVRGTVRMLRDGAVRWSLTSSYPEEDTPEWASESVQIGSIGSAVGVLGMWTGADHTSTDPLGPAWAWKIA